MPILHIIAGTNDSVMTNFIRFTKENFAPNEHQFLIIDEGANIPNDLIKYSNTELISNGYKEFNTIIEHIRNNDLILLHSLFAFSVYQLLFFISHISILKKMVWIAWGGDLYQWKRTGNSMIKNILANFIAYLFRRKIKYFVGIFPPDIENFKTKFRSKADTFYASYVGGLYNPLYNKELDLITLDEKIIKNDCIIIQVGHQCNPILNHIVVLDSLAKFKDKNIRVYLPLSYGDMEYGDKVEQHAKTLFGDKVICIREMMSEEDYMDFLSKVDIAIFNIPRQIGLGNIVPLLYMEKKIFIPEGTVMYEYYKSQNIEICNYNQIDKIDFDMFSKPVDMKKAKQFVKSHYINKENNIERWQKIFNLSIK